MVWSSFPNAHRRIVYHIMIMSWLIYQMSTGRGWWWNNFEILTSTRWPWRDSSPSGSVWVILYLSQIDSAGPTESGAKSREKKIRQVRRTLELKATVVQIVKALSDGIVKCDYVLLISTFTAWTQSEPQENHRKADCGSTWMSRVPPSAHISAPLDVSGLI